MMGVAKEELEAWLVSTGGGMESVKQFAISWLDWAAEYAIRDPYDFLGRCEQEACDVWRVGRSNALY